MIELPWQGALWMARDFCLLEGVAGSARPHAHYAHQALLAKALPFRLTLEGELFCGRFLLVESMRSHAIEDPSQEVVAVYAEPLAFSPETLRQLLADAPTNLEALADLLQAAPRQQLDPRIANALATVDTLLEEKVSAVALAQRACLSLSQLERLFSDQVGLSVRRLVLWRRLRLALRLALEGATLTRAAMDAGFADAAHFSRTMRATFGIRADRNVARLSLRLID
ncbi:AraC family transcriptional regulator [Pseudomonas sp. JS3066]|uniref:helix-turn-helix domain-containing protein n=1 Tax=unclassified Pseudomonas TaxID=196821 RepID=UPI000EA93AA3|nr:MULTISPECIES: AraC family transcriptional regulator [unclassified Pseudomonas]AYF90249.1 AraC family transcriptional regulator [Pseudomonas sp. DY-1]WVK92178.1 AraC family transcriptional regulator [Pseudomonas sp. JS3066]